MLRIRRTLCVSVLTLLCVSWSAARAQDVPESLRGAVDRAVAAVKPALVRVHVVFTEYGEGRELKYESSGSGAIITPEGHAITNHHVAGHAVRVFCTLPNREEVEAELVGADPLTDIAVIKLMPDKARDRDKARAFPVASFGDSAQVRVGDTVLAMGCPMSLSQSVTLGIVSNTEMTMPRWTRAWGGLKQDGEDVGTLVKWIGHDATIAGGSSGGPLVNLAGEIVGINELSMGLGGAIPGNLAKRVAERLIEDGAVKRAWLGLTVQPRLKDAREERGVLVCGTIEDSPAAAAGFLGGDLLVALNGVPIDVQFDEELPEFNRIAAGLPIGEKAEAVVLRDGQEVSLTMTPVQRERFEPQEHELKAWGITARGFSFVLAKEMKRDSRDGVLVTSVRPGGGAGDAKPEIVAHDVIVEVDGKPVKDLDALVGITKAIREGQTKPVPVITVFERKTERFLTVVEVGLKKLEDPGLEVKKAWLPIETQVLTRDVAGLLDREDLRGFRITRVYADSAADQAGLEVGDIIWAVDGERLEATAPEDYEELSALIRQYKVGTTAELSVLRGAKERLVPVALPGAPKLAREMKEYRDDSFEFTARDLAFFDKAKEQWPEDQHGVIVSAVKPGGWAALGELDVGDLILGINDGGISDIGAFEAAMTTITEHKPSTVVLQVRRGIYTLYLELEPKWDDETVSDSEQLSADSEELSADSEQLSASSPEERSK